MPELNTAPPRTGSVAQERQALRRGGIVWFVPIYLGMTEAKARPGVVVSNNVYNGRSGYYTVVPMTTQERKELPVHVAINHPNFTGTICCESIQTIRADQITKITEDYVTLDTMKKIEVALARQLGLPIIIGVMS